MAAGSSVINVAILGDAKKFKRTVGEASDKMARFKDNVAVASTAVVKSFRNVTVATAAAGAIIGKNLFDTAQDLTALTRRSAPYFLAVRWTL